MNLLQDLDYFKVAVQSLLDGEASPDEEKQLMHFLATSPWHSRYFENEKQFHSLLRHRLERQKAPADLHQSIWASVMANTAAPTSEPTPTREYVYIETPKS
ncbi:hypothetical protein [Hugenholtzia roseola]|uniref:hypothetical protein n=1 Tax=Hugenholtzia roseola TaxID=1002 RepID=UPI00047CC9B0|nr:hypothetical protein [Hugenholtzia roseola]